MYAHCLYCHRALGRNEAVEAFPVGRRLAYDAAKGRLWVVCGACGRWNLTPLEERWEAIEQAERLYRGARQRVATEHVGLAHVPDGTELIRVGAPLRPEFAAWRYGAVLRRRRLAHAVRSAPGTAVGVAGLSVLAAGSLFAMQTAGSLGGSFAVMFGVTWATAWVGDAVNAVAKRTERALVGSAATIAGRVPVAGRGAVQVRRGHLAESGILAAPGRELGLALRHDDGTVELAGDDARRALAALVPAVNLAGAADATVREAVRSLDARGGSDAYLEAVSRWIERTTRPPRVTRDRWTIDSDIPDTGLFALNRTQRLALEMALHEERERRAMEGELAALEAAWRQAEELAAIADNLLVPDRVERAFAALRGRRTGR